MFTREALPHRNSLSAPQRAIQLGKQRQRKTP